MKVCLNIDGVFKIFEIVVLANFHDKYQKNKKKKLLYFYPFFVFEEKDHDMLSVMPPCIINSKLWDSYKADWRNCSFYPFKKILCVNFLSFFVFKQNINI